MFKRNQSQIDRSRRLVLAGAALAMVHYRTGGKYSVLASPDVEFLCLMVIQYSLGSITSGRCSEKMSPRGSPSDGVERSEGILSAPLFPRRFAGKVRSGEERENTAVFAGYQNQFIALFTLCKTFIDNLYFKKKNKQRKTQQNHKKGSYVCGVQSSKGSLLGLTLDTPVVR